MQPIWKKIVQILKYYLKKENIPKTHELFVQT